MRPLFLILGIVTTILLSGFSAQAQCKNFTKNKCIPKIAPYIYNGQMNSALLNEGDIAELVLTFYANQDYRVLICSEEQFGKISFRLYDIQNKVLFDNTKYNYAQMWDFSSTATQQIRVEVEIPEGINPEGGVKSGCVSILVGFKDK
ncbi:MAG TPA: hypothetical protein PK990_07195 [Salinivirgaceae bacterium]|nr:hypothetical protein [Salinivirgaceae bacterium]